MTPERWREIRDLFDEAAELPSGARTKLVAECTDADVRSEVLAMLGALTGGDPFASIGREADAMFDIRHEGKRLGQYRLIRELGAGGMGRVYLAERDDDQYRTQVAVKILQRGFGSATAVARFRDERQILATLEHPGIVRLLDGGTDEGLPYLVMERVEGVSITQHADERALSITARIELFLRVCEALQYAHQRMIVHRDLKPSNILVDATGAPKLLDFGIAKLLDDHAVREAHTGTGLALFTPEYASPEQVRAQRVSAATDVYSMGAVLYHLLAGVPPHRITGDAVETLRVICDVDPPPASTVAPADRTKAIAGDLDNITSKALAKLPSARYAPIEQLAEDLRRHLGGLPIAARANTWSYRAGRFVRRNRTAVLVAIAISTALVGAAVISIMQARAAREAAAIARARADQLVLGQADELRERDPTAALALLKQYPVTASWERARDIVADAAGRGVALHVLAHPRQIAQIALAADGTRVITRQDDGALRSWDIARRSFVDLPIAHDHEWIELSPDGTRLVATTNDRGIRIYDTTSWRILATLAVGSRVVEVSITRDNRIAFATAAGNVELWDGASITSRHIGSHKDVNTVAVSPDGSTVASTGLDKRVVFWDLAGAPPRVFETPTGVTTLVYSPDGAFVAGTGWAIERWNVATGERTSLDRPLWRIGSDLAFVDGNRIALAEGSGDIHIWSPANGDLQTFHGHRTVPQVISASVDGRTLVTAADREVRVWSVPPRRRVVQLRGTATHVPAVSSDCRYVASGDSSGKVTIWNTVTDETFVLAGHTVWVNTIAFAPDGNHLLSTDYNSVQLWDLATRQARTIRTSTSGRLKWSHILPDGRFIVIDNDELLVLGADTVPVCRMPGGSYRTSADGHTLAVHHDGTISIVDLTTCRSREVAHKSEPTSIDLSPDGTQLAMIGFESGQSELLDLATGTVRPLEGREVSDGMDFSSDGKLLAAAGRYGSVRLWDTATAKLRRSFVGHRGSVGRVKFSPDNATLATIDSVGALRTWSVTTDHREVHYGHASNVMGVDFCARGEFLATSGFDGTLRIWPTAARPRPTDPVGLRAWLGSVTTAEARPEGGIASPPR